MIVSFEFYVMNFVEFVVDCYSHITSHVSQTFVSCTHNTSYSLLNIVHAIMCVFSSNQPSLQLLWVLRQNIFCGWEFKERIFENLKFEKTGFKTCVLEKHFITYSCILFLIFNALRIFSKNQVISSKILVFLFFFFKISIDPICLSINQNYI